MKEDAGREGSEGEERLLDSPHNCSIGGNIRKGRANKKSIHTPTYGGRVPTSLSAASTPVANEMTSITQWTTKPVGYCLHF